MSRLIVLPLDAADAELVWRWAGDGTLPELRRLMEEGASVDLRSPGDLMPEAAWPTLLTGATVGEHGLYNWRPVEPGTYRRTRQPPGSYRKNFWEVAMEARPELRGLLFDAPFTEAVPDDRLVQLIGWGERGAMRRESWPPPLLDQVVARHGRFPVWTEEDYLRTRFGERRLLRALEDAIGRRTDIVLELLGSHPWDFACIGFYELHDGGHAFYRHLDPRAHGYRRRRARSGLASLVRLYRAADAAVGRIRAAHPDADLVVCSPKGFRVNTNGEAVLPQVLRKLGYQAGGSVSGSSRRVVIARRVVRAAAPRPLRRWIFHRVTPEERDRMLERLWSESIDWGRTRAFAEAEYGHGWIRLNVRGREPDGVVEPEDYDSVCAELAAELGRLTHAGTGVPAVAAVTRRDEIAPGPNCATLPDLIVTWNETQVLDRVHHPAIGEVREDMAMMPSAEHTGRSFAIGAGPSFARGRSRDHGRAEDVAATVLHLMGAPLPEDMAGEPLTDLLSGDAARPPARRPVAWHRDPWRVSPEREAS